MHFWTLNTTFLYEIIISVMTLKCKTSLHVFLKNLSEDSCITCFIFSLQSSLQARQDILLSSYFLFLNKIHSDSSTFNFSHTFTMFATFLFLLLSEALSKLLGCFTLILYISQSLKIMKGFWEVSRSMGTTTEAMSVVTIMQGSTCKLK